MSDRSLTPEEIERRKAATWDLHLARTEGPQTVKTIYGPMTLKVENGRYTLTTLDELAYDLETVVKPAEVFATGNSTQVRNVLAASYRVYVR
jgi:hypothetical protein